jgi:uncharacterized membrane protein YkoI
MQCRGLSALVLGVVLGFMPIGGVLAQEDVNWPVGIALPAQADLFPIGEVASRARLASSGATLTRVHLEWEGRWVYRAELVTSSGQRWRVHMNATTGAIVQARRDSGGGSSLRQIAAMARAVVPTVTFEQAAGIGAAATGNSLVVDVRLTIRSNALAYRVTTFNTTHKSEVWINPRSGAVIEMNSMPRQQGDGGNGGGGSGGSGGGNGNGGSGSGGNGGGGGGNPPPALPPNGTTLAAAIEAAVSGAPEGAIAIEAKFERRRFVSMIKVTLGVPGSTVGQEVKFVAGSNAPIREREVLGADDSLALQAFLAGLGGQTPIGFGAAMSAAVGATGGDVSRVEIGTVGATPIYEVKTVVNLRERSVKVHALTGAVIDM